jgi:pimeloyl-ACP methyl ester carboxylesterase
LPSRRAVHGLDLAAVKERVTLTTASDLRCAAGTCGRATDPPWRCCRARAANRTGVARHARLLAGHGYGVLLFDLSGHGESDGRSTSIPARLVEDAGAALDFLDWRRDVRDGRIGVLGVSLGGEVALQAAAGDPRWRAAVLEGVQGASPSDMRASRPDPATAAVLTLMWGVGRMLGGSSPAAPNPELVERIAPRPMLLLSAGRGTEARANEDYRRRGGTTTELWNLAGAAHAAALRTARAAYGRRVVGFLDRALR